MDEEAREFLELREHLQYDHKKLEMLLNLLAKDEMERMHEIIHRHEEERS